MRKWYKHNNVTYSRTEKLKLKQRIIAVNISNRPAVPFIESSPWINKKNKLISLTWLKKLYWDVCYRTIKPSGSKRKGHPHYQTVWLLTILTVWLCSLFFSSRLVLSFFSHLIMIRNDDIFRFINSNYTLAAIFLKWNFVYVSWWQLKIKIHFLDYWDILLSV